MDKNVGGYDRKARFVVGALLLLAGVLGYTGALPVAVGPLPQALTSLALVVGAILLVTGLTRRCVLNRIVGMDTYERS